ncbi:DUF3857 and transglutaminase domain-containing protein [Bosea sp. TWI1241]|uniref:DUF3857 domain-containing transglutaminase family protein n=1 Tax=Bosea sp. TWI1241 TaxID=3148904 RepID=UPI003207E624
MAGPARPRLVVALAALAAGAALPVRAELPEGVDRAIAVAYEVAADASYVETRAVEMRISDERMIAQRGSASFDFDPSDEALELVEASVLQPDGTRIPVPAASIFTRPSAAAQSTPGFVGTQTTTVVFPQLRKGSIVRSQWRHSVKRPRVFGFDANILLGLDNRETVELRIRAPLALPLRFAHRGGFTVSDETADGMRTIAASIRTGRTPPAEPRMVSAIDLGPAFVASSLSGYEQIGAIYAARSAGKAAVTPEIAALARRIAGTATGLDAARKVHDWVAAHIRYVAVYLDPSEDFVPHEAASVLRNGYGDCKDHVVLMQALLAALDIRALPVLVQWSDRMAPLPLWSSGSFNHAMVYLPEFDLYGNPTNPFAGLGALDIMLAGKLVVVASEQGEVRRTPASRPQDNRYSAVSTMTVAADGTVTGTGRITASAGVDPVLRSALAASGRPEDLAARLLLPTPEGGYGSLHASDPRDLARPLQIETRWTSPHGVVAARPATYMTVPLGIDLTPNGDLRAYIAPSGRRRFPVMVGARDYDWRSSVSLPPGSVVERLPPPVEIGNAAGRFSVSYETTAEGFSQQRRLVLDRDVYAAEDYPALEALLYAQIDAQRSVVVYRPPQ